MQKFRSSGLVKDSVIVKDKFYLDAMTILYGLRDIDFSKYKVNQQVAMPSLFHFDTYELYWRYGGKEQISIGKGKTYNCVKICPCLVSGSLFDKGEVMTIWLTDDRNHLPVLIESKLKMGSIRVVMDNVKGNRFPITAKEE